MIAGLTGGIGSGKSTVARLFALLGAAVFYSDEAAKQAYLLPHIRSQIAALLGKEAYNAQGIDRKFIAAQVFGNKKLLEALNAIIHPEVGHQFKRFVSEHPRQLIIKESALLIEAGVTGGLDKLIVVTSPDELRIKRVMRRDGSSREEVLAKLNSQIPQDEKAARADYVVVNDERQLLIPRVEAIFEELTNDPQRLSRPAI